MNLVKKNLIKKCINNELKTYNNQINLKKIQNLNLDLLVEVLITGYLKTEKIFTHPLPNLIFTRDLAVVIGKTILITWQKGLLMMLQIIHQNTNMV